MNPSIQKTTFTGLYEMRFFSSVIRCAGVRGMAWWFTMATIAWAGTTDTDQKLSETWEIAAAQSQRFRLTEGETVEISVRIQQPSQLPDNARLRIRWDLVAADNPGRRPRAPETDSDKGRDDNAFGIYTSPTPTWSKILHVLDPDVYLVYRAPTFGVYELTVMPAEDDVDLFQPPAWREPGEAPQSHPIPTAVLWPQGAVVPVDLTVQRIDASPDDKSQLHIEMEPNDTPEQAQAIPLRVTNSPYTLNIMGTADDAEYFNNGHLGRSGDDWLRLDYPADLEPRLLTACLSIPDQQVVAQLRAYRVPTVQVAQGKAMIRPGRWLPIESYEAGKNPNERPHQQDKDEGHRTAINRMLEPGGVYLLRVEANAPAYDLELRIVKPAPYDDPTQAVRQGLYDHLGQVDAWLTNRPRGAAVDRRIRDSGNLLGTNCMSCHTQSGVWGPAVPFAKGYRPQNVQAWRHLVNTCYQSMRPTNELIDAANNTSLKPLDIGDGAAGTRVAGHAVVTFERFRRPARLQRFQAIRAANHVCQTADPGGINAAGPGANVGQGVVFNYTGEVLSNAWKKTNDPKYFRKLEDKARRLLDVDPKYSDDLGHRIEFFCRYFPPVATDDNSAAFTEQHANANEPPYQEVAVHVANLENLKDEQHRETTELANQLAHRITQQILQDLKRLRDIQLEDGSWSFSPGAREDDNESWKTTDTKSDPSPTALAIIAMEAAGISRDDPSVKRGIQALLQMQHPTGFWNVASNTGFVSTSYALHALARYYPVEPPERKAEMFQPAPHESLVQRIRRVRRLSQQIDFHPEEFSQFGSLLLEAAADPSPLVRYWAMLGLGSMPHEGTVPPLIKGLNDTTKVVREAAHWGLRQRLIDDSGWDMVLDTAAQGGDYSRETAMRALAMQVDTVMPQSRLDWQRLATVFDQALNDDPHPAVRAWATRAAWRWWVWNPPLRPQLNASWQRLLSREEPESLVENAIRYQTHALFIANGHVANASKDHQYNELKSLFANLYEQFRQERSHDEQPVSLLAKRLVGIAATYYNQRGGDGGPGQLGYSTPGAGQLFGNVVLADLVRVESLTAETERYQQTKLALEAAANIPHESLQDKLVDYSLNGLESLRGLAASSISDPRLVKLSAVSEKLEPMHAQLLRGAADPPRRKDLSDPVLKMLAGVSWLLPETVEGRTEILRYLVPDFSSWQSQDQIDAISNAQQKQIAVRDADAAWYLAEGMGSAIYDNPDLHFDELAASFPQEFINHAAARFWVRSVPWILTYKRELPQVNNDPQAAPPIDPYEALRTQALMLMLSQLGEDAPADTRKLAVELANTTAIRRNPEILVALAKLEGFEEDEEVLKIVKNVLSQEQGQFTEQLAAEIVKLSEHPFDASEDGTPTIPDDFLQDVIYFRDYVVPEMSRVLRADERSCMICHGEPGRVPSMELHDPDRVGYLPTDQLLANYRILQQRVNVADAERSKLLRKPLNVQTGEEDGHQGGRRYQTNDPGYLILRKWVLNQVEIQQKYPW